MTHRAMLEPPMPVGDGPVGSRMVFDVTGGRVEGPRISGNFTGPAGEWLLMGADGFGRVDVRAQIETDDGAFVYVQYFGLASSTRSTASSDIRSPRRSRAARPPTSNRDQRPPRSQNLVASPWE